MPLEFTYGTTGYRRLPGTTPPWGEDPGSAFARDLGEFMARLHQISVGEARAAGIPEVNAYERMLGARDVVMPVLTARVPTAASRDIMEWWARFSTDPQMRADGQAVCHHDLWHENLLRSESGRLSGVLDTAHVEVSDPAHDFAAPRYFGDAFMNDLAIGYGIAGGQFDRGMGYRARRFCEAREFGGLAWAIEHDDEAEIRDSIEKIMRGPIFTAG